MTPARFWTRLASAAELGWTAGELFDAPRNGGPGGLVWFCAGEPVRALGPEHAVTTSGRIFERAFQKSAAGN